MWEARGRDRSLQPLLHRRPRGLPRGRPPVHREGDHAQRPRVGRRRRDPPRPLREGRRHRAVRRRLRRGVRRARPARRHHAPRLDGGAVQERLGRCRRGVLLQLHRPPADPTLRFRRDEGPGHHAVPQRRGDRRARHHRALGGFRRRPHQDHCTPRGRRVRGQRVEDVHHLGDAGRLLLDRGAHRRRGPRRHLDAAHRGRPPRPRPHQARQDGLAGVRHRHPLLRRRPSARQQPHHRGERRVLGHRQQLQRRAHRPRHPVDGLQPGLLRRGAGLGP